MKESMAHDPLAPILWEPHYTALDRRVQIILMTVRDCISRTGSADSVIIADFNYNGDTTSQEGSRRKSSRN